MALELSCCNPYIRYVNNYKPLYSYMENERIIYDHELMYVMEGEVTINYDNSLYHLHKSDVFYFRPGIPNAMIVEGHKNFRTHCIHFDWLPPTGEDDFSAEEFYMHSVFSPNHYERIEQLKKRPLNEPADLPLPTHIQGTNYEQLASLFTKCYYAFIIRNGVSAIRLKAVFWEIIALLAERIQPALEQPFAHPQIVYAIEYLKTHYANKLTAAMLARRFGLSPKYFGSLFKQATGASVNAFILSLRLYAAKEMLIGTTLSVEEIAAKTGFQNPFYFSRCFKEAEKLSPSGYRNLMKTAADNCSQQ